MSLISRRGALKAAGSFLLAPQGPGLVLEPTPFVLKSGGGPRRQVDLRLPPGVSGGRLAVSCGAFQQSLTLPGDQTSHALLVPEPERPAPLTVTLDTTSGGRLEAACQLQPARRWTFYMTPHTHYDIGYTAPQPEVMDRLTADMDEAVRFCEETAAWPGPSRFRWNVEVTGLMRNFIQRRTQAQVDRFMELAREGRIEICGYYLNMPTEVTGHEETIRCLYYAETLRRRFGVKIDTVMINDVPGYAWALADLLAAAGMRRASFRANSINGRFLWYRPGAVPRPFWWEGPAGGRLFTWYTHTYRDGNFFRQPGLHEDEFLKIIQREIAAGVSYDDVQLRMGGDNLPPDLDASGNTRDWNEKYVWPRVVMATNREFLDLLEARHGASAKVFRGDIPSWWADGPGSAALENGRNRLAHDRLAAAEALWTQAWLGGAEYPQEEIEAAYDQMIHFDEHTWGSSGSISHPAAPSTLVQWKHKAAYAAEADARSKALFSRAVGRLSAAIPRRGEHSFAVWNTLAWTRADVVELPLADTPFAGPPSARVVDTRTGREIPSQFVPDTGSLVFVLADVPALGSVVCTLEPGSVPAPEPAGESGVLENRFYKLVAAPAAGAFSSLIDKELDRELLDPKAGYLINQAIYESPPCGREGIDNVCARAEVDGSVPKNARLVERAVFDRTVARQGRLTAQAAGPVFDEIRLECSCDVAPGRYGGGGYPRIAARVRLYRELKLIDIANTVTHEEVYTPEALYFAFPFQVPSPVFHCQIADAVMRPGLDQLPYSCYDYYSIQQWIDVNGGGIGVTLAPLEAPLVTLSGLNVRAWADRIEFRRGHIYSWVMNNYWFTNFKAAQGGVMPFRYRLTSYSGSYDGAAATRFGWQPFHPLTPVWLPGGTGTPPAPLVRVEGDPVVVSSVKRAEAGDDVVVRLLEVRGREARCTLHFGLPRGCSIREARRLSPVETPVGALPSTAGSVSVTLRASEIATIGLRVDRG